MTGASIKNASEINRKFDDETVKLAAKLLIIKYKAIARKQQEVQASGR